MYFQPIKKVWIKNKFPFFECGSTLSKKDRSPTNHNYPNFNRLISNKLIWLILIPRNDAKNWITIIRKQDLSGVYYVRKTMAWQRDYEFVHYLSILYDFQKRKLVVFVQVILGLEYFFPFCLPCQCFNRALWPNCLAQCLSSFCLFIAKKKKRLEVLRLVCVYPMKPCIVINDGNYGI